MYFGQNVLMCFHKKTLGVVVSCDGASLGQFRCTFHVRSAVRGDSFTPQTQLRCVREALDRRGYSGNKTEARERQNDPRKDGADGRGGAPKVPMRLVAYAPPRYLGFRCTYFVSPEGTRQKFDGCT